MSGSTTFYEWTAAPPHGGSKNYTIATGNPSGTGTIANTVLMPGQTFSYNGTTYTYDGTALNNSGHEETVTGFFASSGGNDFYFSETNPYSGNHEQALGSGSDFPVCLMAGTRVATTSGDVAVEHLAIGDQVITASGEARRIRWLGHRAFACARHPNPAVVWPICIRAGAFADAKPVRDLWVSPGHSILHEGVLIQAAKLVNGVTIVQVPRDRIEYWHVELDSHDIILTEGLPTESYLDTGNRTVFVDGGAFLDLHPDFGPKHWTETCVPLIIDGPEIERARTALLARAEAFGHVITAEADLHIVADGKRIEPVWQGKSRTAFILAAGCKSIALRSRSFIPAYVDPASTDKRELGVRVSCLQIDDSQISLEDDPALAEGWHRLERRPDGLRRWTTGYTPLPSGTRLIVIDLVGRGYYWKEQEANRIALVG